MRIKGRILKFIIIILYAAVVLLSLELLNGFGIFNTSAAFPLSLAFILLLYFIAYSLIGKILVSVGFVNICLLIIYILNFYRMRISSLPFQPNDFLMASKVNEIMSFIDIKIEWEAVVSLTLIIAETIICGKILQKHPVKFKLRSRMIIFSTCLAFFTTFFSTNVYMDLLDNPLSKTIVTRYEKNGIALGFYMSMLTKDEKSTATIEYGSEDNELSIASGKTKNPSTGQIGDDYEELVKQIMNDEDVYSEEFMEEIISYIQQICKPGAKNESVKPNVVVIMSEAFTDPSKWPNIEFSQDPVPTLHMLQQTAYSGNIITPAFGGATCDPEYEFLTGNIKRYTPDGDTPFTLYEQYISELDTRSLPSIFSLNGYKTLGIHTFGGNKVYPRKEIYPLLNFDEFLAQEDMEEPKFKGYLGEQIISDEYFTDKIIEALEKYESEQQPLFLYGISMQNHAGYFETKYRPEDYDIFVSSDMLNEQQTGHVHAYAQGVYDADKQLGRLIDYLSNSSAPTIVFFFGDHQPLVGEQKNEVFEILGYVHSGESTQWTLEENYEMRTTPYIMWANYDLPEHDIDNMSAFFIGSNILNAAGLEKNLYFEFLSEAYKEFNGMNYNFFESKDNTITNNPVIDNKLTLEILNWLQYDTLFGKKYVYDRLCETSW